MLTLALQPTDTVFLSTAVIASVDGRSKAVALSSVFFVLFPVKVVFERDFEDGFLRHIDTRSMLAHTRVSFKEFEYVWDLESYTTSLTRGANTVGGGGGGGGGGGCRSRQYLVTLMMSSPMFI